MNITEEQINQICNYISILDIKSYIEQHRLEYEQFLEEEKQKEQHLA